MPIPEEFSGAGRPSRGPRVARAEIWEETYAPVFLGYKDIAFKKFRRSLQLKASRVEHLLSGLFFSWGLRSSVCRSGCEVVFSWPMNLGPVCSMDEHIEGASVTSESFALWGRRLLERRSPTPAECYHQCDYYQLQHLEPVTPADLGLYPGQSRPCSSPFVGSHLAEAFLLQIRHRFICYQELGGSNK